MFVFVAYSSLSLEAIREFLLQFGPASEVSHLRVSYDRDGFETDRTILVMHQNIYDKAVAAGFNKRSPDMDFSIAPYHIGKFNLPKDGFTFNMYLPLPRDFTLTEAQVRRQLNDKLKTLVGFGAFPSDSYRITVPKLSRESGELKGSCFLTFDARVDSTTLASVRLALDNTSWSSEDGTERETCHCYWAFDHVPAEKKPLEKVPAAFTQPKTRKV